MFRSTSIAALLLAAAPAAALEASEARESLQKIAHLKSMDMQDVMCDECLEEIDCIWPCEIMCVLDYPTEYAGKVCQICLEFYGCEGCKFLCPTEESSAPTMGPSPEPSLAPDDPTKMPSASPTVTPTSEPTGEPSTPPSAAPSVIPTAGPSELPTLPPTMVPTSGPTEAPTLPPTAAPTASPSYGPTEMPSVPPTAEPTTIRQKEGWSTDSPTAAPSAAPTVEPTFGPTTLPTFAPSITPQFFVYYSSEEKHLYSYNPATEEEAYLFDGDMTGDIKVDSVNKFMFWTSPDLGLIQKYDLTTDDKTMMLTLKETELGVMGLALDPSRGELFFARQDTQTINVIDYAATNTSTVVDLSSYNMVPYGVEISPAEMNAAGSDPGYMLFTGCDSTYGYIMYADLFGSDVYALYQSDSRDMFGIVVDAENDMMWWIENKGVANGLYSGPLWTDDFSATYVTYLEEAYWLAGVWEIDIIYVCDTEEGEVYEFDMDVKTGQIVQTDSIAQTDRPRGIAFYWAAAVDETPGPMAHLAPKPNEEMTSVEGEYTPSSLTGDVPGSDIVKEHKDAADQDYDQYEWRTDATVGSNYAEKEKREPESSNAMPAFMAGGAVVLVVGAAALVVKRQRGYAEINNELSI
mmetsp:Transcript_6119/g.15013  ORF Transcript_6119/g.15013 Transcript_6119/m.15013 type:complete len:633 (+) Transcript_6119:107-2005(+)